jgi:hypothetical protein
MDNRELANRFDYHPPDQDRARRHQRVRSYLHQMAEEFNQTLPEGREKSLVMTHLEEAMFWANAAIAREGG